MKVLIISLFLMTTTVFAVDHSIQDPLKHSALVYDESSRKALVDNFYRSFVNQVDCSDISILKGPAYGLGSHSLSDMHTNSNSKYPYSLNTHGDTRVAATINVHEEPSLETKQIIQKSVFNRRSSINNKSQHTTAKGSHSDRSLKTSMVSGTALEYSSRNQKREDENIDTRRSNNQNEMVEKDTMKAKRQESDILAQNRLSSPLYRFGYKGGSRPESKTNPTLGSVNKRAAATLAATTIVEFDGDNIDQREENDIHDIVRRNLVTIQIVTQNTNNNDNSHTISPVRVIQSGSTRSEGMKTTKKHTSISNKNDNNRNKKVVKPSHTNTVRPKTKQVPSQRHNASHYKPIQSKHRHNRLKHLPPRH